MCLPNVYSYLLYFLYGSKIYTLFLYWFKMCVATLFFILLQNVYSHPLFFMWFQNEYSWLLYFFLYGYKMFIAALSIFIWLPNMYSFSISNMEQDMCIGSVFSFHMDPNTFWYESNFMYIFSFYFWMHPKYVLLAVYFFYMAPNCV